MGNAPRVFDPQGVYHVVNRGNNKEKLFFSDDDYGRFLEYLADVKVRFGIDVFHYCLMPNHVHLMLRPNKDLSAAMHGLFMPFAKWFCKKYGHKGHVRQGPFRPTPVLSDAHLYASGNYIEMNPVRAGLVERPEDWPYSSYRYYARGENNALVTATPFFENLGKNNAARRETYRKNIASTRTA